MLKTILITGANGQLGQELQALSKNIDKYNFLFTDKDTLDITDPASLQKFFNQHDILFCINAAAYTKVDLAESERQLCNAINIEGVCNLADICDEFDTRLIHISTDFVFDGERHIPYKEDSYPNPLNVYGNSKVEGEQALLDSLDDAVIIRTSWLYSSFGQNFVKTMLKLGKSKTELSIVEDQIGSPTYAKDLAQVIMTMIQHERWFPGIYHFSNDGVASWYDFAHAVFELSNIKINLTPIKSSQYKTAAKRPHYSVLDKTKVKKYFHIQTRHWREALKDMLAIEKSL